MALKNPNIQIKKLYPADPHEQTRTADADDNVKKLAEIMAKKKNA